MKLRLLFLLFGIVMSLNGAQIATNNEDTLFKALQCADKGELVICRYNDTRMVTEASKQAIDLLRKDNEKKIVDYVLVGRDMCWGIKSDWLYCDRSIQDILDFSFTGQGPEGGFAKFGWERGLVLYNIKNDCKVLASNPNYVDEIKLLRENGWKVLVNAQSTAISENFEKNFPGIKTFVLPDEPKQNYVLRNILVASIIVIVFTFLFSKLGGR